MLPDSNLLNLELLLMSVMTKLHVLWLDGYITNGCLGFLPSSLQ